MFVFAGPMGGGGLKARPSGAAAQAQAFNTPRVAFQIIPAAQAVPPQVCASL